MHVLELKHFLTVSLKGLKVKVQYVEKYKYLLNLTDSFREFLLNCIKIGPPIRVKELLQRKQSDLPTSSSSNGDHQAQLQANNCGTYPAESAKALLKYPETGSMTKVPDGLPPFTFLHSIVRHVRKSGKRMQKCADFCQAI